MNLILNNCIPPANRLAGVELARVDRELAACWHGDYGDGPLWLYMLGYLDWTWERELICQELKELQAASRIPLT